MSGPGAVPRHAASRTVIGCNAAQRNWMERDGLVHPKSTPHQLMPR